MSQTVAQYDKLRRVGAFIEGYKNNSSLFAGGFEEFNDSRYV